MSDVSLNTDMRLECHICVEPLCTLSIDAHGDEYIRTNIGLGLSPPVGHLPLNYIPVSLTSITCKLFEHIICKHRLGHTDRYCSLST